MGALFEAGISYLYKAVQEAKPDISWVDLKNLSITEHKPWGTHTVNSAISCQNIPKDIVISVAGKILPN